MTTDSTTLSRPAPASSGTPALFRRASVAEWSRLWSVRTTWWLLLAATLLMALVTSTFVHEALTESPGELPVTAVGELGLAMAMYGPLVIAMLAVTAEFSTGAIRTSLQWVPRRGILLAARTTVVVAVATVMGTALVVAADLALWAVLRDAPTLPDLTVAELAASAGRAAVVMVGSTLLTVGLGFALRHSAGTLTAVFLLLFVLPASLVDSGVAWLRELGLHLPGSAVVSLLGVGELVPSDARATTILLAWACGAMALGTAVLLRRDV